MDTPAGKFPADFAEFIAPMPESAFFSEFYDRKPALWEKRSFRPAQPALTPADVRAFVGCLHPDARTGFPAFRIVRHGTDLPRELIEKFSGQPASTWIPKLFNNKWTLVPFQIDDSSVPCRTLAAFTSDALQTRVTINAYYTPPGAIGLGFHTDPRDVFILQQAGRKIWKIWDRTATEEDEPLIETILEPEQMLYIPTGFPHAPKSTEEQESLHLTIGFYDERTRAKANLRKRLEQWSELPDGPIASPAQPPGQEPFASLITGAAEEFLDWLQNDLAQNPPKIHRTELPESDRPVEEVQRDLAAFDAESTLRLLRLPPDLSKLQSRFDEALTQLKVGEEFQPRQLPVEEQDALNLTRLLIGNAAAEVISSPA